MSAKISYQWNFFRDTANGGQGGKWRTLIFIFGKAPPSRQTRHCNNKAEISVILTASH